MIDTGCKPGNFSKSQMTTQAIPLSPSHEIQVHSRISSNSEKVGIARISRLTNEWEGNTWHENACHVAPKERTLSTWVESKCHTSILHERIVVGKWA